jgi:antitoxin YefM
MNAITLREAKRKLGDLITQVIADAEPAIICNEKGEKAVLLALRDFNSWQETLYLLSNPANAEHLRKSIAEAKMGKIVRKELIGR